MIVLDASVVVEYLTNGTLANSIKSNLEGHTDNLIAPHLVDVEVEPNRGKQILAGLAEFPVRRYEHTPLLGRIWELRHNFTSYDPTYIALAEETGAAHYTCGGVEGDAEWGVPGFHGEHAGCPRFIS